ncbi:MAG: transcription termination/antitermination protein NusA [Oscillospiraceae bacterium]|nr:transcription termination/antitermination protein NusA [Oscillospiraceae bacterium]
MNNNEFFEALELLEKERDVPAAALAEKIETAVATALRRDYPGTEGINVKVDFEKRKFTVTITKMVVEEVVDEANEITLDRARTYSKRAAIGKPLEIKLEPRDLGRIVAQNAKHIIRQGFRDAEKSVVLEAFQAKVHEIVSALVQRVDPKRGTVTVEMGKHTATLPKNEQIKDEELVEGQRTKVYIVDVQSTDRGPRILISRTHPGLVKRLFELEVPEIYDGTVEIKSVAREAGSRTKIAVFSNDENVDPVGACIGARGARIDAIVEELGGEKIDVVKYSEDPKEFIAAALSPANVLSVELLEGETKACRVTVPDHQLSLAIGNKGQNAYLAVRLTGYKIDIRPESGFYGE